MNKGKREKIDALLSEMGAVGYSDGGRWRTYRVIVPEYEYGLKIGLPLIILVNIFGVRLSTNTECLEYMDYISKK